MKNVKAQGAQGDVLFRRVASVPEGAKPLKAEGGQYVVAHSETGHHHTVASKGVEWLAHPTDPQVSFLRLKPTAPKAGVDVVHHRPFDTHETLRLLNDGAGEVIYEVRRQREFTPTGWRRVED